MEMVTNISTFSPTPSITLNQIAVPELFQDHFIFNIAPCSEKSQTN